jgi:predicted dehydrogenase
VSGLPVAVLGCGYWGRRLAERFDHLDGATLVGLCDSRPELLARARAEVGDLPTWDCDEAMLAESGAELVVIAATPTAQPGLALRALRAGRHVLVEKPPAFDGATLRALQQAADAAARQLHVSAVYLFDPLIQRLIQLVADGELGELRRVDSLRYGLGRARDDVSVVDDLLPHDLYILHALLGRWPRRVQALGSTTSGAPHPDSALLQLDYGDATACLTYSVVAPRRLRHLQVVGTQAAAVASDDRGRQLHRVPVQPGDARRDQPPAQEPTEQQVDIPEYGEPLVLQCQRVLDCIGGLARPVVPAGAHEMAARALAAARESLVTGRAIEP